MDQKVTTSVWNGQIPLELSCDAMEPLMLFARRCGYLSMILPQVQKYLSRQKVKHEDVWFEFDGIPLKWHYPIGVLYDMMGKKQLPWRIQVKTNGYPKDKLFLSSNDAWQDVFLNSVKEADHLRHGSTKKVMTLSKQEQDQFYNAMISGDHDKFWHINERIIDLKEVPRNVPIRFYFADKPPIQEPIAPTMDGKDVTLGEALNKIGSNSTSTSESIATSPNLDASPMDTSSSAKDSFTLGHVTKVMLHGIEIPLDTPLSWLSNNMTYPDGFVHAIVE